MKELIITFKSMLLVFFPILVIYSCANDELDLVSASLHKEEITKNNN